MKKILPGIVLAACAALFSSCEKEENVFFISTDPMASQCGADGVWNGCWTNTTGFDLDGVHFSHDSGTTPEAWWTGFCPSTVRDTKEYAPGEWEEHQWASSAGHSARGDYNASYLVAHEGENGEACVVTGTGGITFKPYDVYVSNTTLVCAAMKNGTDKYRAFTGEDWYKVTVTGYRKGEVTASEEVYLFQKGVVFKEWKKVRLRRLGLIDRMVFTVSSSAVDDDGKLLIPAYFCIDAMHMH